jgi:hypothetical protein
VTEPTFMLTFTREQAEQLFRLVSIAELAIGEHERHGWLPAKVDDAALMERYLKALTGAPSLERPFGQFREWLRQQERAER